jgi:osmotically-inducible protein OsmY
MKHNLLQVLAAGALLAGAAVAGGRPQAGLPLPDATVARNVQQQLMKYGNYGMFDEVSFQIHGGEVTLTGSVTEPFKKSDMEKIAAKAPGVEGVTDNIRVLPFSDADNALRRKIATAFRSDASLSRYEQGANPSIHVVVDQGRATLTGTVRTQNDKSDAALLSQYAGSFAVTNDLEVASGM